MRELPWWIDLCVTLLTHARPDVLAPNTTDATKKFPLIVYAHGLSTAIPSEHYKPLFEALVTFGYVIIAPRACATGCKDDKASLPHDPPDFGHYYMQVRVSLPHHTTGWSLQTLVTATEGARVGTGRGQER